MFFSGSGEKHQGPLWEIDRDNSRHQIQIEDHPRTAVLMRLPAPRSGAPHAAMFRLILLISPLSLEDFFSIFHSAISCTSTWPYLLKCRAMLSACGLQAQLGRYNYVNEVSGSRNVLSFE
jgi:hypothetical protein